MLDLITASYKLTINVSSYLQEYIQYPVEFTYNRPSEYQTCPNTGQIWYSDPFCVSFSIKVTPSVLCYSKMSKIRAFIDGSHAVYRISLSSRGTQMNM